MHINYVKIECDPAKNDSNLQKHGIPLTAAQDFEWETALEREDDRFDYGEMRFVAIGLIARRLHVLVFAEGTDNDTVRAISLRLAEKHEARFYHDHV